jgi:hypothetical protein
VALAGGSPGGLSSTPVIYTGQPIPGGGTLASIGFAAANGAGQTVFATQGGMYRAEGDGTLTPILRGGDPAPGIPGALVGAIDYNYPVINSSGQVGFLAYLQVGPGGVTTETQRVLYTPGAGNELVPLIRSGMPALGGGTYSQFGFPQVLSDAGHFGAIHYFGGATTPERAVYVTGPAGAGLTQVARDGTAVATPPGAAMEDVQFFPLVSDRGTFVFGGNLQEGVGGVTAADRGVIYRATAGGPPEILARTGTAAPGTGRPFTALGGQTINQLDHVAFWGFTANSADGIWEQPAGGALSLAYGSGQAAPGAPAGAVFAHMGTPVLNARDHLAFQGALSVGAGGATAENNDALWGPGAGGQTVLVAREGEAAPGAGGAVFNNFFNYVLNAKDQMIFQAGLKDAGGSNQYGLWAFDPSGGLALVVREGDLFEVAPGDRRTVGLVSTMQHVSGNEDGQSNSLGDDGRVVFRVQFADGTAGVFSAQVPEPSGVVVLAAGAAAALRRRGRRGANY